MRAHWNRLLRRLIELRMAGPKLMRAFARTYPRAVFVEIGANDGVRHDFLRKYILRREWTGVMVEPLPQLFSRLRDNYARVDRVALEQAAISVRDGTRALYHLAPDERLPYWQDMVASFDRAHVEAQAHAVPGVEGRIVTTEVPTLSFASLCARHGIERLDLLVVDTEGHDWEILRGVDLERHRPRLVVYEHFHLQDADREAALAHFRAAGYETLSEGFDTFCLDPLPDTLTARWRRLKPFAAPVTA